jgi:hypothetical protein
MDTYQVIAEWIGWPPIVIVMLILGGIWFRFFRQQLTIEKEKYDLVEKKLKDCREQTSVVLITELAETRKRLQEEIEYLYGQSKFDNEKILALENQLQETNLKLEEQREFIEGAQDILDELVLPREGKLNGEVELDIQKTIKEQSCIYIPVGPYWHDGQKRSPYERTIQFTPGKSTPSNRCCENAVICRIISRLRNRPCVLCDVLYCRGIIRRKGVAVQ